MITVSVSQLMSAIEEADVFNMPPMSEGAEYLYNRLYKRLSYGEEVCLSEIDYDSFELDDIDSMRDIYYDTLEGNESKSDKLVLQ